MKGFFENQPNLSAILQPHTSTEPAEEKKKLESLLNEVRVI
jgi:hypothetical protein